MKLRLAGLFAIGLIAITATPAIAGGAGRPFRSKFGGRR
jgi:hypothetical protein